MSNIYSNDGCVMVCEDRDAALQNGANYEEHP